MTLGWSEGFQTSKRLRGQIDLFHLDLKEERREARSLPLKPAAYAWFPCGPGLRLKSAAADSFSHLTAREEKLQLPERSCLALWPNSYFVCSSAGLSDGAWSNHAFAAGPRPLRTKLKNPAEKIQQLLRCRPLNQERSARSSLHPCLLDNKLSLLLYHWFRSCQ